MNMARTWFIDYGMKKGHDNKTIINALDNGFVAHAKKNCNEVEEKYINDCVIFQNNQLKELKK